MSTEKDVEFVDVTCEFYNGLFPVSSYIDIKFGKGFYEKFDRLIGGDLKVKPYFERRMRVDMKHYTTFFQKYEKVDEDESRISKPYRKGCVAVLSFELEDD